MRAPASRDLIASGDPSHRARGLSLNAGDVVPAILEVMAIAGQAPVRAAGTSMWPTIPNGAMVTVGPLPRELRAGQIVLMDWGGRPVLHRIVRVGSGHVITAGDSCLYVDPPTPLRHVHALATVVRDDRGTMTLTGSFGHGLRAWVRYAAATSRLALARAWRRVNGHAL